MGAMTTETVDMTDEQLVAQSLAGDRCAYGQIVGRYQSLICGVTFAGCGDLHRSEDLAQETFLEAWRNLGSLKEPDRLRAWLCGISRNLLSSDARRRGRAPATEGPITDQTAATTAASPVQEAITREEQALIWSALDRLPIEYREPMVLYYRQQESVAAVATALDLTEEAARQRLVRGRAMLADRLDQILRRGLRASAPTRTFTLAVLAAIPGAALSAKASTLGAAAKGGAAVKAATSAGIFATVLLGPICGLLGGYIGYRNSLHYAIAPQERRMVRRYTAQILLLVLLFNAVAWIVWDTRLRPHLSPTVIALIIITTMLIYCGGILILIIRFNRAFRRLRDRLIAESPALAAEADAKSGEFAFEYRSRSTLLGLPLLHINIGAKRNARPRKATGWIAIGAKAYGLLFAFGAVAVAPVSVGALSLGVITMGGAAAGLMVWGGMAIGGWTIGGLAIGWKAVGGCALAISAAQGGVAVARDFAEGGIALARHANDAVAGRFCGSDLFFRFCNGALRYANWLWLLFFLPALPMLLRMRGRNSRDH